MSEREFVTKIGEVKAAPVSKAAPKQVDWAAMIADAAAKAAEAAIAKSRARTPAPKAAPASRTLVFKTEPTKKVAPEAPVYSEAVKQAAAAMTLAELPEPTRQEIQKAGGGVHGYFRARTALQREAVKRQQTTSVVKRAAAPVELTPAQIALKARTGGLAAAIRDLNKQQ